MTYPEGVYQSIGFDNLFNPVGLPRPSVGPAEAGPSYLANRTRQRSWFLTDNFIINDQWRVFGGLRHTSIEQYGAGSASDVLTKAYDKAKLNPTLGLIYKPTPKGTIYASYAEGIEQGDVVNGANYTNNGVQLSPLTSQQIEAGIKWEVGRDALLTAAVFQIDKGLEIDQSNGDGTRTRVQDGRQVHRGVELTAAGQVSPNLRLLAGLAVLNAEVTRTSNTALIGKKPQGVPEWQANLYADYALSALAPGLSINGGVYYGGKKAIDQGNLWFADSYMRLDAGIKYSHPTCCRSGGDLSPDDRQLDRQGLSGEYDLGFPAVRGASYCQGVCQLQLLTAQHEGNRRYRAPLGRPGDGWFPADRRADRQFAGLVSRT